MVEAYRAFLADEEKLNEITKVAFENININNSGAINKAQLGMVMSQIYMDLSNDRPTRRDVDEVFNYLDSGKKGYLNFEDVKVLVIDILRYWIQTNSI